MEHFAVTPPAAITRILSRFRREQLAGFVAVAIDLLDVLDPPTEETPDFSPQSDAKPGDPEDTEPETIGDAAWPEWHTLPPRLRGSAFSPQDEDDEDTDGGGDCTDDEPGFSKRDRAIANRSGGGYPGCPIGDPDHDGVEFAEGDYGSDAPAMHYGVDQSREIGPDNPAA